MSSNHFVIVRYEPDDPRPLFYFTKEPYYRTREAGWSYEKKDARIFRTKSGAADSYGIKHPEARIAKIDWIIEEVYDR